MEKGYPPTIPPLNAKTEPTPRVTSATLPKNAVPYEKN